MQRGELCYATERELEPTTRGRILLIDDNAEALEARTASLRREGHEVHAYASFPEGSSCLNSEQFDLIMVKLSEVPSVDNEEFWSVASKSTACGPAFFWHAASIGLVTWMWRSWELWTN